MIADTGIEPIARDQSSVLFYSKEPSDFSDVSKVHHGTFIYTQVANKFSFGPIAPADIEIARVATKIPMPLRRSPMPTA